MPPARRPDAHTHAPRCAPWSAAAAAARWLSPRPRSLAPVARLLRPQQPPPALPLPQRRCLPVPRRPCEAAWHLALPPLLFPLCLAVRRLLQVKAWVICASCRRRRPRPATEARRESSGGGTAHIGGSNQALTKHERFPACPAALATPCHAPLLSPPAAAAPLAWARALRLLRRLLRLPCDPNPLHP